MAILVTGGAGYIGSHTVRALEKQERPVLVLDNLVKGHRAAVRSSPLLVGDIGNRAFLASIFAENTIEAVIHFAAHSLVGESMKDPALYFENNVANTLNLLAEMHKHDVRCFVFSSTAAVYGEPELTPIPEEHPKKPESPYGESKLFVERILHRYSQAYNLRYASLRYFNAAGADPTGDIGEDHKPETHLIPLLLQTVLGQRGPLTIFGTDYPTPDGTCVRDYVHVHDLSQAHVLALDRLFAGHESFVVNLGNGDGFSVREVAAAVQAVTGQPVPVEDGPRRPGDPAVLVAKSDKAQELLTWTPQYSDLRTIVETAWRWHRNHPDGFPD